MIKSTLLDIGLSEKEADFYLTALRNEALTASQIAKINNESRTHSYDTIGSLIKKGLLNYVIKNNVKYFKATNPEKILGYLEEKEKRIKETVREAKKIIPHLKKEMPKNQEKEAEVEVYEGEGGLKAIMNDILKENKNFVTWGATNRIKEFLPKFFIEKYLNERRKKGIKAKQLFTDLDGVLESSLSENRKLPKKFASPTTTLVYGNNVSIWAWLKIPKVILIKSESLASSYKKHFKLMWQSSN